VGVLPVSIGEHARRVGRVWPIAAVVILVVATVAVLIAAFSDSGEAAAVSSCPRSAGKEAYGTTLKRRVTLGFSGPANPINMADTTGIGETDIVVNASPALPPRVTSRQITITVPKRFERSGANLTSEYLPVPTFTRPRILERGKLVAFTLCVDVTNAQAGSYIGQVVVGGPKGVQPATVAITVNAKNGTLFLRGLIAAILLAFLLLLAQASKKRWDAMTTPRSSRKAIGGAFGDLWGFWFPAVVAIVAAVVAVYQVWDSTAAWGADTGASLIALGGTTLSATGIGGFLSSLRNPGST
jgi:hypothetical protein